MNRPVVRRWFVVVFQRGRFRTNMCLQRTCAGMVPVRVLIRAYAKDLWDLCVVVIVVCAPEPVYGGVRSVVVFGGVLLQCGGAVRIRL